MNSNDDELEAFFAAARSEAPVPGTDLLSAILADAAEVSAARRIGSRPRRRKGGARRFLDLFGGWQGAAALAACALVGFWVGMGNLSVVSGGGSFESASSDSVSDPVAEFFDLASGEG